MTQQPWSRAAAAKLAMKARAPEHVFGDLSSDHIMHYYLFWSTAASGLPEVGT
jgi:hypothetical protein